MTTVAGRGCEPLLAAAGRRLGARFVERAASEVRALYEQLERARIDRGALVEAARVAHSICGAGASFGFRKMGSIAGLIERRIRQPGAQAFPPRQEFLNELHRLVICLEHYVRRAANELGCASIQRAAPELSSSNVSERLQP